MIAYLDTSTLVKVIAQEPDNDRAKRVWYDHPYRFTSRMTYAEARAALGRLTRARSTTPAGARAARDHLEFRWTQLQAIEVSDGLVRLAGDLAERRGLRGYDAVHLASALILGDDILMATWDTDLRDAAAAEGLATLNV